MFLSCTVSETPSLIFQNLKKSLDLNTSLSGIIYRARALVLLCIDQHTTFRLEPKFILKTGRVTLTTPIREYFLIPRLTLDIFYLRTKFGDFWFRRCHWSPKT